MTAPTADEALTLLAEIDAFCRKTGLAETLVGRRSLEDSQLVPELRRGRMVRPHTAARVRAWMAKNRDRKWHPQRERKPVEQPVCLAADAARSVRERADSATLRDRIVALYNKDARRRGISLEDAMKDQLYPGWRERCAA